MATATWNVTKQMMSDTGTFGGGAANPGDLHIPLGKWDPGTGLTWVTRALLYAPVSFSGMTGITSAFIKLRSHTAAGWHANGTGTKNIRVRRRTATWSETSHGSSSGIDELWGGNGATLVVDNSTNDGDADQAFSTDTADNTLISIDITNTVLAWFNGAANHGVKLEAASESSANDAFEFYSRHSSGKVPYIEINYTTNTAPAAPTNLSPTGNEVRHTGTSFLASGTRSDPDSGDYITAYQILVYKDDGTTLVTDSGKISVSGSPTTFSRTMSVSTNGANKYYKWKARTWDKAGTVGPYSALQRVKLNTVPNPPGNLSVETDTLTPFFSGSFSDADAGDSMTAIQMEVAVNTSPFPRVWGLTGDIAKSGTSWNVQYAGSALSYGTQYAWRVRSKDSNGGYSDFSGWQYWTPIQPTGPTQSPRTTTAGVSYGGKINDTTPDLTLTYSQNFRNHEIRVYSDAAGTNLVFSHGPEGADYANTLSKVVTVTPALTNGATYYWKARVELSSDGTMTAWAGFVSGQSGTLASKFYINALPTAPTGLAARNDADAAPNIRDSDGMLIVTERVPILEALYGDPDSGTYGDTVSARSIEIYDDATPPALVHSSENLAPAAVIPMRYYPGTLTNSTTLAAAPAAGNTNIKVTSVTGYAIGDRLLIGPDGGTQEVRTIASVGTAGSGGTGIDLTQPLIYAHANGEVISEITPVLSNETVYKMRWRFQDNSDTYGAWSGYTKFKVTQVSAIGSLTPSGTITSPAFTAAWSHTSPGGKAQGKYRVVITRDSDGDVVYDTGTIVSSTESHAVPGGFLQNGTAYTVSVAAIDTDNV